jgi:hypothetical protein
MNKLALAAAAFLTLSPLALHAGDPQGPESLDTGSLAEYYDPTLGDFSTTPPPSADVPSTDNFAAVFADITDSSGTFGEEWLIPYDPNGSTTQFSMINDTDESFTISNAGFQLSPTQIPLDQLNDQSLPNNFAPLTGLDTEQLSADGGVSSVVSLPEPSSLWLVAIAAGAFGVVRFAHQRAAKVQA